MVKQMTPEEYFEKYETEEVLVEKPRQTFIATKGPVIIKKLDDRIIVILIVWLLLLTLAVLYILWKMQRGG